MQGYIQVTVTLAYVGMARSMIGLSDGLSPSSAATLLTNFTNYRLIML